MACSWSALRCSGVYQFRRTCTGELEVSGGLDLDVMRTGGEFDGAAHVIEAVGGGHHVILVGLQDVAVDAALEAPVAASHLPSSLIVALVPRA